MAYQAACSCSKGARMKSKPRRSDRHCRTCSRHDGRGKPCYEVKVFFLRMALLVHVRYLDMEESVTHRPSARVFRVRWSVLFAIANDMSN